MRNFTQNWQTNWSKKLDKYIPVAAVIMAFGGLGTWLLVGSHAATPTANIEAESGTISSAAGNVADSSASGGHAVKFGVGGSQVLACNLNATTANFASQVSAASAGQVICLASGSYGTFSGTNKAVTITAASGASVTMGISFGSGDSSFTVDGSGADGSMNITGGEVGSSANHITVKNAAFTAQTEISLSGASGAAVVFDHDSFNNQDTIDCTQVPARLWITGTSSASDFTVSNSLFSGGNLDGIQAGTPNGATIVSNEFYNIYSGTSCNHTDSIQLYGGENMIIRGNYIHDDEDGVVAYDGTANNLIEDNVIYLSPNGYPEIALYADTNSIIRHNTLPYGSCEYGACGTIVITHKSGDPASKGTVVKDNIATGFDISSDTANLTDTKNMLRSGATGTDFNGTPVFAGGASPTSWAGFKLASGSPGIGAASDGTNVGIN